MENSSASHRGPRATEKLTSPLGQPLELLVTKGIPTDELRIACGLKVDYPLFFEPWLKVRPVDLEPFDGICWKKNKPFVLEFNDEFVNWKGTPLRWMHPSQQPRKFAFLPISSHSKNGVAPKVSRAVLEKFGEPENHVIFTKWFILNFGNSEERSRFISIHKRSEKNFLSQFHKYRATPLQRTRLNTFCAPLFPRESHSDEEHVCMPEHLRTMNSYFRQVAQPAIYPDNHVGMEGDEFVMDPPEHNNAHGNFAVRIKDRLLEFYQMFKSLQQNLGQKLSNVFSYIDNIFTILNNSSNYYEKYLNIILHFLNLLFTIYNFYSLSFYVPAYDTVPFLMRFGAQLSLCYATYVTTPDFQAGNQSHSSYSETLQSIKELIANNIFAKTFSWACSLLGLKEELPQKEITRLKDHVYLANGITSLFSRVSDLFLKLVEFIGLKFAWLEDVTPEITKIISNCDAVNLNLGNIAHCEYLLSRGHELLSELKPESALAQRLLRALEKVAQKKEQAGILPPPKINPVVIAAYGPGGTGKSALLDVAIPLTYLCLKEPFDRFSNVFSKHPKSDYFEGYRMVQDLPDPLPADFNPADRGSLVYLLDDINVLRDDEKSSGQLEELMRCGTQVSTPLNFANLADKGMHYMTSEFIFATTNATLTDQHSEFSNRVTCREALVRRIDFCVNIKVRPNDVYNFDLHLPKKKEGKPYEFELYKADMNEYELAILMAEVLQERRKQKTTTIVPLKPQLVDQMLNEFQKRARNNVVSSPDINPDEDHSVRDTVRKKWAARSFSGIKPLPPPEVPMTYNEFFTKVFDFPEPSYPCSSRSLDQPVTRADLEDFYDAPSDIESNSIRIPCEFTANKQAVIRTLGISTVLVGLVAALRYFFNSMRRKEKKNETVFDSRSKICTVPDVSKTDLEFLAPVSPDERCNPLDECVLNTHSHICAVCDKIFTHSGIDGGNICHSCSCQVIREAHSVDANSVTKKPRTIISQSVEATQTTKKPKTTLMSHAENPVKVQKSETGSLVLEMTDSDRSHTGVSTAYSHATPKRKNLSLELEQMLGMYHEDQNMLNVFRFCSRNIFAVKNDDLNDCAHGLFIKGSLAAMPRHLLPDIGKSQTITVSTWEQRYKKFQIEPNQCVYIDKQDLVFVMFPLKNLPPARDISRHFVDCLNGEYRLGMYANTKFVGGVPVMTLKSVTNITAENQRLSWKHNKMEVNLSRCWKYNVFSERGDCGSPVFINDKTNARKILGLHVAYEPDTQSGRAVAIDQVLVEDVLETFENRGIPNFICHSKPFENQFEDTVEDEESVEAKGDPTAVFKGETHGAEFYEEVEPIFTKDVGADTSFEKVQPLFGLFKNSKVPAKLRSFNLNGEWIDPGDKDFFKGDHAKSGFDESLLDRAVENVSDCLKQAENAAPHLLSNYPKRNLDDVEVLNGVYVPPGEVAWVRPINMKTSAGYPYNLENVSGKKTLIMQEEDGFKTFTPELHDDYKTAENDIRSGDFANAFMAPTKKDELRPIEKVLEGKTRMFICAPVHFNLLIRKYFGMFMGTVMALHNEFEVSVGINVHGLDWTYLAKRLKIDEEDYNIIAGDHAGWDRNLGYDLAMTFADVANRWYDDDPANAEMRRRLCAQMFSSKYVYKGVCFRVYGQMPSGVPITAVGNSIINLVLLRTLCYHAVPYTISEINQAILDKKINFAAYGDDHIVTVTNLYSEINQRLFQKIMNEHMLDYTDAFKNRINENFTARENLTYLKRTFEQNDSGRYRAPLEYGAVCDIVNWKKKNLDLRFAMHANRMSFAIEIAHYGKGVYMAHMMTLKERMASFGAPFEIEPFEDLFRRLDKIGGTLFYNTDAEVVRTLLEIFINTEIHHVKNIYRKGHVLVADWCPSYLRVPKARGGSQHLHHTCRTCARLAMHLCESEPRRCLECLGYKEVPEEYYHVACDYCSALPLVREVLTFHFENVPDSSTEENKLIADFATDEWKKRPRAPATEDLSALISKFKHTKGHFCSLSPEVRSEYMHYTDYYLEEKIGSSFHFPYADVVRYFLNPPFLKEYYIALFEKLRQLPKYNVAIVFGGNYLDDYYEPRHHGGIISYHQYRSDIFFHNKLHKKDVNVYIAELVKGDRP